MRFWALAATLIVASGTGTAHAANIVNDRSHLWPTSVVDFVVCDEAGVERLGDGVCRRQARWWQPQGNGPELGHNEAWTVREAIDRWNEEFGDNIRLREADSTPDGPYIVFRASSRADLCSTRGIGYSRHQRRKYISIGSHCNPGLSPDGTNAGAVLHEIMHAVGIYHEQQRFDRGALIRLDPEGRAVRRFAHQWRPVCTPALQECDRQERGAIAVGPYDFGSIMHYSVAPAGARLTKAGWQHLVEQGLDPGDIGQRDRFSEIDIQAVEMLYPSRRRFASLGAGARPTHGLATPPLEP